MPEPAVDRPSDPPFDSCPGCGSVSVFVRGAWETVHEDDCSWFHGPDPIENDDA